MRLQSAEELSAEVRHPKLLVYGEPGVGKTTLAAQAPRPTLYLDIDMGAEYLKAVKDPKGNPLIDLDELYISRGATVVELATLAEQAATKGIEVKGQPIRSLVIDTLTELQTFHRSVITRQKLVATRDDWGQNTEWVRRIVKDLTQAPLIVVFVCHIDWKEDPAEGMFRTPALTPALLKSVNAYMHAVIYLAAQTAEGEKGETPTTTRLAISTPLPKIWAKDRTSMIPSIVKNPTWESLFGPLTTPQGEKTNGEPE